MLMPVGAVGVVEAVQEMQAAQGTQGMQQTPLPLIAYQLLPEVRTQ
jgi:hypothetical protein